MVSINKTKLILVIVACFVFVISIVSSVPKVWHPPTDIVPQGAGSGLDADLLDGLHASDILASIPEGSGGSCYINWDGISCYEGYSALTKGKITVVSDPDYGSGGVMCANVPDRYVTAAWGVTVEQSNIDCALCCR